SGIWFLRGVANQRVEQGDNKPVAGVALALRHAGEARVRHAETSAGLATAGSTTTNVAPCPGFDSAQMRPPFASVKPLAIASPRPAPRVLSPATRWKGSKIRSRSSSGIPGP